MVHPRIMKMLQISLNKLHEWCKKSGAKISAKKIIKVAYLQEIVRENTTIKKNVEQLEILGIMFTKNYLWNARFKLLKKALISRTNIISYLANKKSNVRINTLIYLFTLFTLRKVCAKSEIFERSGLIGSDNIF